MCLYGLSQTSRDPHFVMNSGEDVNCAHTQLQLRRKYKLCHSFYIGFGNESNNAVLLNWSRHPKKKGLLEPKQEIQLEKVVHSAKAHLTAYRSCIDDICGPSLGHKDRDVAPKNSVTVEASNLSHSQVHVSGSMCSSSSNWGPLSSCTYHLHPHISP